MTFSAEKLPPGVQLNAATGQLTGTVAQAGVYPLVLHAANSLGTTARSLRLIVGDQIGLTPAMGWNSWNCLGAGVNQDKVLAAAQDMVSSGLAQHGWTYINIDDTWQGKRGGDFNAIQPDLKRFPDIASLVSQIHALGLKSGIYSTPWTTSYAGHVGGSSQNEQGNWDHHTMTKGPFRKKILPYAVGTYSFATEDAKQWAAWGIDYLKYDWGPVEIPETQDMANALHASGRDILFSLSNNTSNNIFDEIADLSKLANSWRITTDINDSWGSVCKNGFAADKWAPFSVPGHFNDPDMLVIGHIGWHPAKDPSGTGNRLNANEEYSHVSLWCLLSAPLLLSCDLDNIDPFTLGLITNDEVIDIDQDALGKQATTIAKTGDIMVYAKPLEDGSWAVGLFNRGTASAPATLDWTSLNLTGSQTVRDVWRQKDLGNFNSTFTAPVDPHGVLLLRLLRLTPAK